MDSQKHEEVLDRKPRKPRPKLSKYEGHEDAFNHPRTYVIKAKIVFSTSSWYVRLIQNKQKAKNNRNGITLLLRE